MTSYTIIIPHYNIPELLVRCLQSIPVREDIQVIVVDDCSLNSMTYKTRFPEFSRPYLEWYSTSESGSAGRARNIGVKHAKGKWILFVDADDLLSDNALELLDNMFDYQEDIVFYKTRSVMSDNLALSSNRNFYDYYFEEYIMNNNEENFRFHFHSLWGKVFKASLIHSQNIRFDETLYSNDVYFSAVSGYFAKSIKVMQDVLYIVTERAGSLASSQFEKRKPTYNECKIRLGVALKVRNFMEKHGIPSFSRQFTEHLGKIRAYYPLRYFIYMLKFTFTCPTYIIPFIKKDLRAIYRHVK